MEVSLTKSHFLQRFTIYLVVRYLYDLFSNGHFDISTGRVDLTDGVFVIALVFSAKTHCNCFRQYVVRLYFRSNLTTHTKYECL
jgi:hypothetical protein